MVNNVTSQLRLQLEIDAVPNVRLQTSSVLDDVHSSSKAKRQFFANAPLPVDNTPLPKRKQTRKMPIETSYPFNEVTAVFLLNNPRYHHTSHSDEPLSYHWNGPLKHHIFIFQYSIHHRILVNHTTYQLAYYYVQLLKQKRIQRCWLQKHLPYWWWWFWSTLEYKSKNHLSALAVTSHLKRLQH